jgi:Protein of unknown function (DUF2917)
MSEGSWRVRRVIDGNKGMSTATKLVGKENSIAGRKKQTVIPYYTRDHRAPPAAGRQRPVGEWRSKVARAFLRMRENRSQLEVRADHKLSKGSAKRMYLENGARISCRRGKVWITLDEGGEDIVLAASESRNFRPGTRLLIEALAASRISFEAL